MPHRNAPLTETGRLRLARSIVEQGWPVARAAERFQVSRPTATRWARRYRELGPDLRFPARRHLRSVVRAPVVDAAAGDGGPRRTRCLLLWVVTDITRCGVSRVPVGKGVGVLVWARSTVPAAPFWHRGFVPTTSFYLGPRKSRLQARSWDDVLTAAATGVLEETHWVELKEAVPSSSKPANLELAKDLASLSVDGGVLIVGIADAKGAAGDVVGTELAGLETRIAQVASGRISPPLPVTIDIITKPDEATSGVVLVTVPASEGAPHTVGAAGEQMSGPGSPGARES